MEDSRLDQLIIDMARSGMSHVEIIRTLARQGYEADQIQSRVNELYYAGALIPTSSDELEHVGVHELKTVVDHNAGRSTPHLSRFKRYILWARLHPVRAIVWSVLFLVVIGGGVGGYTRYIHAPVVVMERKTQELAHVPLIGFTIVKQASTNDVTAYTLQGVVRKNGEEVMDITLNSSATGTPWKLQLIHDIQNVTYMRLISGPVPYSFIYNIWISLDPHLTQDEEILRQIGLGELNEYSWIPSIVWMGFSTSPVYHSIIPQPAFSECVSPYQVTFGSLSETLPSPTGSVEVYVRSLFYDTVWDICTNPSQGFFGASSGDFSVMLSIPATLPAFSVDVPATPIDTVKQWIQGGGMQ